MNAPATKLGRSYERIAVVRALQLGDLLSAIPAFRSLRAGFPSAEITLIGLPWAQWLVQRVHQYIDHFVEFPGFSGIDEVEYVEERAERGCEALRDAKYDLIVQLHGSGQASNRFVQAIAQPGSQTAGYFVGERPEFLTFAAPYPDDQPEVLRNLKLMRLLGCPDTGCALELPLLASDQAAANELLAPLTSTFEASRPLIGIHAGSRSPARRWPPERFALVADHLAYAHGARILLTGSPEEEVLAAEVASRMRTPVLNLAGKTSLGGLAALIARLDLFISNDTGPAHLANAVDTPSVTIFGPAEFLRWAPLDQRRHAIVRRPVACSPCPHWICPIDHRCLRWIAPDDVIAAAERQLVKESVHSCDD
ncbi:MAG TPA: glycosyltransferase family 9 protein [Nitrolancea sp.]|nr:glycosyltransferase family 9 protein [Nitrolancea sp.]